MDATFQHFLQSGRTLVADTKGPRRPIGGDKQKASAAGFDTTETDPYRIFSRKMILEKPSKADVVKEIRRFIEMAEAAL